VLQAARNQGIPADAFELFLRVVNRGRNGDGRFDPELNAEQLPLCDWCREPYPAARLMAVVELRHICPGCADVVQQHRMSGSRPKSFRGHLVRSVPGEVDSSSAGRQRY